MKNKSPIPLRIIAPICLLVWMGLIFCLSGQNAAVSSAVSGGLIRTVIKFILPHATPDKVAQLVEGLQFFVRKGAHFTIYAILGIFSFLSVVTYEKLSLFIRFLISALVSMGYAVSDEYHQTFISGRSGELRDILIDSTGAVCGILFSLAVYSICKHKKRRGPKLRKKKYIELTEDLQRRLYSGNLENDELRSENESLIKELSALKSELSDLRGKLTALERSKEETSEKNPEPISEITPPIETAPVNEPELAENINVGAKYIGKIVLASAEYCNRLTALGADPSFKELLNLILGRTEVAKAEILRLSALEVDQLSKQKAMETEYNEALDYFKSVMAQK